MDINFDLNNLKTLSAFDARNYLIKYFIPLSDGNHAMLVNGSYVLKDDVEVKKAYFGRISKELKEFYLHENCNLKTVTYALNKPTFFDDKINLCPSMKFTFNTEYIPDIETETKMKFFLKYIFEVLSSSKQDHYEFIIKWLSNMIKGNKNNSCLYLKGIQGIGKSTLFEFMSKYVVGEKLSLETGSDPIRTKFNKILGGKLLVSLEELENFGKNEWELISSTLKRMITSPRINLQNKGSKSYESENINNYMLCSNNDAIKDDEGRRYFILDISTHRLDDTAYFTKLYGDCFNNKVGEAMFHYLYKIDTEGFNPQRYPMTQNKADSHAKRLDSVYQFLKDEFIFKKRPIKHLVQELYDEYLLSINSLKKPYNKQDFNKKMADIGVAYYKTDGVNKYKITYEDLLIIATKKYWIHELDEFEDKEAIEKKEEEIKVDNKLKVDNEELKTKNDDLINLNKSMSEELEKIKKEMEELKAELIKPKVKKTRQTRKQINIIITNDEDLEAQAVEEIQNLKNSILDLI